LVQPKASQNKFVTLQNDAYKVNITAPPVDGKANKHLINFIAKAFGVKKANVQIVSGMHSRRKIVRIQNPRLLALPVLCRVSNAHPT
ncbi:hypothetical protein TI05_14020, partial [Achromatium sp. WMS3]